MNRQLVRIAPWQAGKVCAVIYFMFGVVFAIPFALIASLAPAEDAAPFDVGFAIALPFLYAIGALIFVPIGCWVYNLAAKLVGGFEVEVASRG